MESSRSAHFATYATRARANALPRVAMRRPVAGHRRVVRARFSVVESEESARGLERRQALFAVRFRPQTRQWTV